MRFWRARFGTIAGLFALAGLATGSAQPPVTDARDESEPTSLSAVGAADLEGLRLKGDLQAQRGHAWKVFAQLTDVVGASALPQFESWYGEEATFAKTGVESTIRGIRGFSRPGRSPEGVDSPDSLSAHSADTPILSYTLYNFAAYDHIRTHRLNLVSELNRLSQAGPNDASIDRNRSVPAFPSASIIIKTAWWPVARDRLTPLPVWDPEDNPPRRAGNGYLSWKRVVAVDPLENSGSARTVPVEFAGGRFQNAKRIELRAFYHVKVDDGLARNLMLDPSARKAALVVLGRPIQSEDYLVLVGANLATKEIKEWVWGTVWWHDRADEGPFAMGRPPTLPSPWKNYLLQVAFDATKPLAKDGGPHICFNPWLEGRFPDAGEGGGVVSNCLACHQRASYPTIDFLPVVRGRPSMTADPAYAPGRLRTNFIWAIAMHSSQ